MEKATREQTKSHNTRLVLKTVYRQPDISRADIARITNLTRTTVSDIVADLIQEGFLEETGLGESAGGKPPILINFKDDSRQLICLDLSGPEFTGAIVNLRGQTLRSECIPLQGRSGQAALDIMFDLLDSLYQQADAPILGIGIGVPGLIHNPDGVVRRSVRLQWNELPLKKLVTQKYSLPVFLINDSHAAALAEVTFGEFRQSPNLIVVRINQGIGAGIILSGQIHYGDGYGAGEIGHLTVVEGGAQCSCGNYGCLETVASPAALVRRVTELAEYDWISISSGSQDQPDEIDWEFLCQAFIAGDETVTELIKEAGRYLGISIANLVSILNVRRIIITGRFMDFGETFLQAVRSEVEHRALFTMAAETYITNSKLGRDHVIQGISALVLSDVMDLP